MDKGSDEYKVLRAMAAADDDQVGISRIQHMLRAAEALGWKLVHADATDAMWVASGNADDFDTLWTAMHTAAPSVANAR